MAINLDAVVVNIIVSTIIISPALWVSGRLVVGSKKARFTDALVTVALGMVIGAISGAFFSGIIAAIIQLIIWLALVRHFFECSWGAAFAISILGVIIFIIVAIALGLVGITLFTILF